MRTEGTQFPQTTAGADHNRMLCIVRRFNTVSVREATDHELDVLASMCSRISPLADDTGAVRRVENRVASEKHLRLVARRDESVEICSCGDPYHDDKLACARCGSLRPSVFGRP